MSPVDRADGVGGSSIEGMEERGRSPSGEKQVHGVMDKVRENGMTTMLLAAEKKPGGGE